MSLLAASLDDRIAQLHPELLGFLRRRVPGQEQELAQEVWLRLVQADPHIERDDAFRSYTYTVARRVLIDRQRRRRARIELVELTDAERWASGGESPDGRLSADAVLAVVERELAAMKPEVADVFRERALGTRTFREIAHDQGVPLNTALGRMHNATRRIHRALRDAGLIGETP